MRLMKIIPYLILSLLAASPAISHEFWIDPVKFVYASDGRVQANLKVGQKFRGSNYSYNPNNFRRFETRVGGKAAKVKGRFGDLPALEIKPVKNGLVTIVHETTDSLLSYTKWEKFVKFAKHKAFPTTLDDHVARGIAKDKKFVETYRRYAKSLVAVGIGGGSDGVVGLKTEIVALQNPYQMSGNKISVKVLLDGAPRANTQVELFERSPSNKVKITLHRTNAKGVATLPVKRGYSYLVDAVTMNPTKNDDPSDGPVWKSHWASLTFMVPKTPLK